MWWEVLLGVCVALQLLAGLCTGVTVTQKERFMVLQTGFKANVSCEHDDTSYITILWYRQKSHSEERQMQLIGYSTHGTDPVMEMDKAKFTIERSSVLQASLIVDAAQTADTASYFCAASQGTV